MLNLAMLNLAEVNLADVNLAATNLAKPTDYGLVDINDLLSSPIEAYIVALGSNFNADKHLAMARDELEKCALVKQWSTAFVNADYTATPTQPKPDYSNQCGYLLLSRRPTLQQLIATTKCIETLCQRVQLPNTLPNPLTSATTKNEANCGQQQGRVSVDIDVLAVQVVGKWQIIEQRYPFKDHEQIGLNELIASLD